MAHDNTAYPEICYSPCAEPSLPPAIGTAHQPSETHSRRRFFHHLDPLQQALVLAYRRLAMIRP